MNNQHQALYDTVLTWYEKNGRKNLPWQLDNTPYHTWISEIMLQQTQVATVIDRYQKFTTRWPNIDALASADIDQMLTLWSGLGYYARARNIHKTVCILTQQHNSQLPNNLKALCTLPGIGRTTAGAILSLGFNQAGTILDGNIKRTLSRLFAIDTPINQPHTEKTLWQIAEDINHNKHPKHYNQAMMDIGAMICKKNNPQCSLCPLKFHCKSYQQQLTHKIPRRVQTKKNNKQSSMLFIYVQSSKVLLGPQPNNGIWGGLYCPPMFDDEKSLFNWCKTHQLPQKQIQKNHPIKHELTHKIWYITPYSLQLNQPIRLQKSTYQWLNIQTLEKGIPQPVEKIITAYENNLLPKT